MKFPIVGSCVLFSLFLAFKFLPKDIVNMILSGASAAAAVASRTPPPAPLRLPPRCSGAAACQFRWARLSSSVPASHLTPIHPCSPQPTLCSWA